MLSYNELDQAHWTLRAKKDLELILKVLDVFFLVPLAELLIDIE